MSTTQSPELQAQQPYVVGRARSTLTVTIEVQEYADFQSCRRLEATITLQRRGHHAVEIGYIIAWFVDKSVIPDGKKKTAWVAELRETGKRDAKGELDELKGSLDELFTKTGLPRAKQPVSNHRHDLSSNHIVYVDTFFLEERYRRKGLNVAAMELFHSLVAQLQSLGPSAPRQIRGATVLLSPAALADVPVNNDYDEATVERKLIQAYERSDYAVWVQGDEDEENSRTIMGRTVGIE